MEIALALATLLGGGAALWFFWDKLFGKETEPAAPTPSSVPASLSASPTKSNIENAILKSDAQSDWNRGGDQNRSVVAYKQDMNLRFEILYLDEGVQCEDFREPWANRHPDPKASGYWCNLLYGATIVERFILVSVDGGRALLPIPKKGADDARPDRVLPLDYKVAQIHDSLGTLDEYMRRSGLKHEQQAA